MTKPLLRAKTRAELAVNKPAVGRQLCAGNNGEDSGLIFILPLRPAGEISLSVKGDCRSRNDGPTEIQRREKEKGSRFAVDCPSPGGPPSHPGMVWSPGVCVESLSPSALYDPVDCIGGIAAGRVRTESEVPLIQPTRNPSCAPHGVLIWAGTGVPPRTHPCECCRSSTSGSLLRR